MHIGEWIQARVTDYTPGVGRVFVRCTSCQRVVPYYRLSGRIVSYGCRCGNKYFRPVNIPEWQAALWLAWGWVTGKGDPRVPERKVDTHYA